MEDGGERDLAPAASALEDTTDAALSRLFGSSLQAATLRMVLYLVIFCVLAATVASLV
jgi:hypothetical protein